MRFLKFDLKYRDIISHHCQLLDYFSHHFQTLSSFLYTVFIFYYIWIKEDVLGMLFYMLCGVFPCCLI